MTMSWKLDIFIAATRSIQRNFPYVRRWLAVLDRYVIKVWIWLTKNVDP